MTNWVGRYSILLESNLESIFQRCVKKQSDAGTEGIQFNEQSITQALQNARENVIRSLRTWLHNIPVRGSRMHNRTVHNGKSKQIYSAAPPVARVYNSWAWCFDTNLMCPFASSSFNAFRAREPLILSRSTNTETVINLAVGISLYIRSLLFLSK